MVKEGRRRIATGENDAVEGLGAAVEPPEVGAGRTRADQTRASVDLSKLRRGTQNDSELIKTMIRQFLDTYPNLMVDLHAAVENGDATAAAFLAHKIGGSVTIFGADHACALASEIEEVARETDLGRAPAILRDLEAELEQVRQSLLRECGS